MNTTPTIHTRLSVNLNKVALIRNARGGNLPDLRQVALDCQAFGAEGITVHPRPDQRHIRFDDIPILKEVVHTEFNIEGNPTKEFLEMVLKYRPDQCTLVPDAPDALTSDGGWDTIQHRSFLIEIVDVLKSAGIRVSLFVDPNPRMVAGAKEVGADRVELYTGSYASGYFSGKEKAIAPHLMAAEEAKIIEIGLNAGHDLNIFNLNYYKKSIDNLIEVSIGQALISDSLYLGLENVIKIYKQKLV